MDLRLETFASITSLQTRLQNNSGKGAGPQHKSRLSTAGENDIDDIYDQTVQEAAAVVSRDKELELCVDEITDRYVDQNVIPLKIALRRFTRMSVARIPKSSVCKRSTYAKPNPPIQTRRRSGTQQSHKSTNARGAVRRCG